VRRVVAVTAIAGLSLLIMPVAYGSLGSTPSDTAPCLKRRHLPAFTAYSLGGKFEGLPLTDRSRLCFAPPGYVRLVGPGPRSVAWTSLAVYGTCMPEGASGSCGPPLEIESWPECDLNFSPFGERKDLRPTTSFSLSGSYKIPTVVLEARQPTQLGMYTGQTTVVIFADSPQLARRAAHALARAIAPKLTSVSAASLRARAVDSHGCHQA
jgi:hypothetical protein